MKRWTKLIEENVHGSPYDDGVSVLPNRSNCVLNDAGELVLTDKDQPTPPPPPPPQPRVSTTLFRKTLSKKKCSWAAGSSGIVSDMVKAAAEEEVELTRQLTEAVLSFGVIPSDWEKSFILNLYMGKGEALDHGNYRGLKLTDQVMKLLEWILHSYIFEIVNIDKMHFGFLPRGTTEALMSSLLFTRCSRSTSQQTNCSTLPSSTLRKHLIMYQGRSYGGP